jgi:L-ascorbate metabolism protein UlaG (beta-lactamase superfamily)
MESAHQNPLDAAKAFHATDGNVFVPFHYGASDLADEPMASLSKF